MAASVTTSTRRRWSAGQSLVEVAVSLPFLLILCLGIVDVTRGFYYREAVLNSARQALRQSVAANQRPTGDTACAVGGTLTSAVPPSGGPLVSIANSVALESSSDGTPAGSAIKGATVTVIWHCLGVTAMSNPTASATDPASANSAAVEVRVTYNMQLITPFVSDMLGLAGIRLAANVVGRSEY